MIIIHTKLFLSVFLGVEPAYSFKADGISNSFDIPVVAKIAYNLKVVEVGISGKYGLVNVFEMDYLKSGKIREIQLSHFIPFKRSENEKEENFYSCLVIAFRFVRIQSSIMEYKSRYECKQNNELWSG